MVQGRKETRYCERIDFWVKTKAREEADETEERERGGVCAADVCLELKTACWDPEHRETLSQTKWSNAEELPFASFIDMWEWVDQNG